MAVFDLTPKPKTYTENAPLQYSSHSDDRILVDHGRFRPLYDLGYARERRLQPWQAILPFFWCVQVMQGA